MTSTMSYMDTLPNQWYPQLHHGHTKLPTIPTSPHVSNLTTYPHATPHDPHQPELLSLMHQFIRNQQDQDLKLSALEEELKHLALHHMLEQALLAQDALHTKLALMEDELRSIKSKAISPSTHHTLLKGKAKVPPSVEYIHTFDLLPVSHSLNEDIEPKWGEEALMDEEVKKPRIDVQCFYFEEMDILADELLEEIRIEDGLEAALTVDHHGNGFMNQESQAFELHLNHANSLEEDTPFEELQCQMIAMGAQETKENKGVASDDWNELNAPKVDLKELPSGLRYAFLGPNESYPVIVNENLKDDELNLLVHELRKFRKAIGYSLDDIKGISPSLCTHRIHLDDESKSSIEHQRRLNPNLKDVVKKEILKLLGA